MAQVSDVYDTKREPSGSADRRLLMNLMSSFRTPPTRMLTSASLERSRTNPQVVAASTSAMAATADPEKEKAKKTLLTA